MLCTLTFNKLIVLVFALLFTESKCICRQSYITFCDDLTNLSKYKERNWTQLVVGSEDADSSQLRSVDFHSFSFNRFYKLTSLTVVRQIDDIKSHTFKAGGFGRGNTEALQLSLYGNKIRKIRSMTFDRTKVRKLSLVNNNIEDINREAFSNCEIESIDLSHNNLEILENQIFSDKYLIGNATKELIIKHNKLETIKPHSFPSSLEILNLDYNNIKYFSHLVFQDINDIKELTFSHNKLKDIPGLRGMNKVTFIDASYNVLEHVNGADFNTLMNLEVLDLSHNKISYPSQFQRFNMPQRNPPLQISLAFNKLTHLILGNGSFAGHVLFLYGNPWDCTCWEIMEKYMADNKVMRNQCDLEFFGNGQIPYCIGTGNAKDCTKDPTSHATYTDSYRERFLDSIKNVEESISCDLFPRTVSSMVAL